MDFDKSYLALGKKPQDRQIAYAQDVCETVPKSEIELSREALQRGQLTGGARFRREISERLGIRISNKGPGRPLKRLKNKSAPIKSDKFRNKAKIGKCAYSKNNQSMIK